MLDLQLDIIVIAGVVAVTIIYLVKLQSRMKLRTEQLGKAGVLLQRHYAAVQQFIDDPESPDGLRHSLLDVSDGLGNEAVILRLVGRVNDGEVNLSFGDSDERIINDLRELAKCRPELFELFSTAISTGILAAILRWPAPAAMFERLITEVTSDRHKEMNFAASAARFGAGLRVRPLQPQLA